MRAGVLTCQDRGVSTLITDTRGHGGIAFLGTCRSGLGHIRRIASVAAKLRDRDSRTRLALITNASPGGLSDGEIAVFSEVSICERRDMAAELARGGFAMAVLDTMRLPGIADFDGPAILILREVPNERLASFRRDDGAPWHQVIVPNPAAHWLPGRLPGFARSVEAAGWIVRRTGPRRASDGNAGIVLATGGGGTAETRALLYPMLGRVIAESRRRARRPFVLRQALGPRASGAALADADEVFDPGGDLNAVFRAADLVISTAGYNSVLELASTDTPALLAAIPRCLDDQRARARLWAPRLGCVLEPESITLAAAWLADQIDRPRRRLPVDLGADGAARAADMVLDTLCPAS